VLPGPMGLLQHQFKEEKKRQEGGKITSPLLMWEVSTLPEGL